MKPRVVYWFDFPTPTPVARCNAVADLGALDFEVWFSRRSHGQSWQVWSVEEDRYRFPYRFVRPSRLVGQEIAVPLAEMKDTRPDVIVHDYWPWHMALGVLGSKLYARRTALRVLPTYDPTGQRTWYGSLSMQFIFRAVDGAKVPGPDGEAFAARYGLPKTRTARVTQTISVGHFARAREMTEADRAKCRTTLGLSGCTFTVVGRLWSGKGLDYMLDAYREAAASCPDVSLMLVGDGPDEERYRALAADLPNVRFTGWIPEEELPTYLALGDVLVFPTLGDPHGLVVDEAMAAGLPVISTNLAGDIARRLPDGEAGFVVPGRDAGALADRMVRLARDEPLRKRMSQNALTIAARLEHEHYARDFVAFVEQIMSSPPRRSRAAREAALAGRILSHAVRPL